MMKNIIKKLVKEEAGAVFVLALSLLVIGGLLIVPLLNFMNTGLKAGQIFEQETNELYAADAGIEDAIWQMNNNGSGISFTQELSGDDYTLTGLPMYYTDNSGDPLPSPYDQSGWDIATYTITDVTDVNGKSVSIAIQYLDGITFLVESTAFDDDSDTTITAFLSPIGRWGDLMDNAITGLGDVTISPGAVIDGDVQYNGELDNKGDITGEEDTDPINWWPTVEELSDYYWDDLQTNYNPPAVEYYTSNKTLDINSSTEKIGPIYVDGDLTIKGTGEIYLDGLIYATGDIDIQATGLGLTIDLDFQTFYAEDSIVGSTHITLAGSGCIIAGEDINMQPNMLSEPGDYILCLAVNGTNGFQPNGNYYGTLAGTTLVDVQPNASITHTDPPKDLLNFPGADGGPGTGVFYGILSWEIDNPKLS